MKSVKVHKIYTVKINKSLFVEGVVAETPSKAIITVLANVIPDDVIVKNVSIEKEEEL